VPESHIDIEAEAKRLKKVMDEKDSVIIFVSEGACVSEIVAELEARGEKVDRDAFGHVKLDQVKVGDWFGKQFARKIGADKTLVQKSGYFARSAASNKADLDLIGAMVHVAVDSALAGCQASSAMTRRAATNCAPSNSPASRAASISTRPRRGTATCCAPSDRSGDIMSLGIGVIGAGIMGADHARIIAGQIAGAHLAAIADADLARARSVAAETGAKLATSDPLAVIEDSAVAAVLIASPDATHADYTLACLKAGKPVLCEKPLARRQRIA